MEKRKLSDLIKIIFVAVFYRLVLYGVFSILYMWLLDWAGIHQFNFRHVLVLTVTIFFIWFFIENNIVSKLKKSPTTK
ncbi:hypothetical protein JW968_06535 [Candidatus Woesearchaeota archaeon]|nr:hypothetical protein [Candidatus Woesearchaeota archaeon]